MTDEQVPVEVQGPPSDEELKGSRRRYVIVGLVLVLVVGGIAYAASSSSSKTTSKTSAPTLHTVVFKVTGSADETDITYSKPGGGTAQQSGLDVPITKKSDHSEGIEQSFFGGDFLYLSAQNHGDSGNITCIIEEDGVEISRNTSYGGYTIATCESRA